MIFTVIRRREPCNVRHRRILLKDPKLEPELGAMLATMLEVMSDRVRTVPASLSMETGGAGP